MSEKAKLMTDEDIEYLAPDPGYDDDVNRLCDWIKAHELTRLCQQAKLANAQAERLERLEGALGKVKEWMDATDEEPQSESKCHFTALHMRVAVRAALSPSTTKGEG